jgi:hypothetical protein
VLSQTLIVAERDGFEPEISLAVLPRTQSETPVPVPSDLDKTAVNARKLPMDGSVESQRRLAGCMIFWRSQNARPVCALRLNLCPLFPSADGVRRRIGGGANSSKLTRPRWIFGMGLGEPRAVSWGGCKPLDSIIG